MACRPPRRRSRTAVVHDWRAGKGPGKEGLQDEALFAGQLLKAHGIQVERGAEAILVLRPPLQC